MNNYTIIKLTININSKIADKVFDEVQITTVNS